jgi:hypothetical protein
MPKGKLTRNEKYIMAGMSQDGISIKAIMEETGRSKAVVEKFLKTLEDTAVPDEQDQPMVPRDEANKTQFLRHTAVKRDKCVSVMTEGESARSERPEPKSQSKIKERFKPVIHQIKDDDD